MVDINTKENVFENEKYLDKILSVLDDIHNPQIISVDGEKIVIDNEGPIFAAVMEIDEHLESFAITLDEEDNKINRLITEFYSYGIFLKEDIPVVSCQELGTENIWQLYYIKEAANNPRSYMNYYQMNEDTRCELNFQYDATLHRNSLANYIRCINNHKPTIIDLIEYRNYIWQLGKRIKSTYIKLEDGEHYGKELIQIPYHYSILRLKEYSFEELKKHMESLCLFPEVPQVLINLYNGNSDLANVLETASLEYKRRIL